jgi:large subunit ribosomal protein L4
VHEVVVAELAARRRARTPPRPAAWSRGGGAKPWRQKGTGRARAGTSRSPIWTGGGTGLRPEPASLHPQGQPQGPRAALRSALSVHAERGTIHVVDAAASATAEHVARRPSC